MLSTTLTVARALTQAMCKESSNDVGTWIKGRIITNKFIVAPRPVHHCFVCDTKLDGNGYMYGDDSLWRCANCCWSLGPKERLQWLYRGECAECGLDICDGIRAASDDGVALHCASCWVVHRSPIGCRSSQDQNDALDKFTERYDPEIERASGFLKCRATARALFDAHYEFLKDELSMCFVQMGEAWKTFRLTTATVIPPPVARQPLCPGDPL